MEPSSSPPWQQTVDMYLEMISYNLSFYLESQEFKDILHNLMYRQIPDGDIHEIKVDIDCFICNVFPVRTKTTEILEHVFLSAVYAQLNTMTNIAFTYKDHFPIMNMIHEYLPMSLIVQETLDRSGRNGESPLYHQVCNEYKDLYEAATKIQRQWRHSITNPAYTMCQQRLIREYKEM
jgi:hypothetical protein